MVKMSDYRIPKYLLLASYVLGISVLLSPWVEIDYQAQTNFPNEPGIKYPEYPPEPEYGGTVKHSNIILPFSELPENSYCPMINFNWSSEGIRDAYESTRNQGILGLYVLMVTWVIFIVIYRKNFSPTLSIYWFLLIFAILFIVVLVLLALASGGRASCHGVINFLIVDYSVIIVNKITLILSILFGTISVLYKLRLNAIANS